MLASMLKANGIHLRFNMVDIGARPVETEVEPFHALLNELPGSRLAGVEIDPEFCADLNRKARAGVRFYPYAIGGTEEKRPLYITDHPACTSLYPPDERWFDLFNALDMMRLKETVDINTTSLDRFVADNDIGAVDFLKIDVQGAELDVFKGGTGTLANVLMIVTEVSFVQLYRGQPLFRDIDAWFSGRGMMFHKFVDIHGRAIKPLVAFGNPIHPVQVMWGDAIFTRDLFSFDALSDEQCLKLAILLDAYGSKDVSLHLLRLHDARHGRNLGDAYFNALMAEGSSKSAPLPR